MAATLSPRDKMKSTSAWKLYDFDPDSADKVDIAWLDMRDYTHFACTFFRTVGTGNVDTFRIIANDASDGSGTDVEIIAHAVGSQPNALADQIHLECTAEEIGALGDTNSKNLRYVSAQVEFATNTDEGVVYCCRCGARFPQANLTADIVA